MTTATPPTGEHLDSDLGYGSKVLAVEPGAGEFIPESERHGRPVQLAWTWSSPNLEFATVFVGVLAVTAYGMTFWQAVAAVAIGNLLGSATQGVLSARGPKYGVPQMVLSRLSFGYFGNALPATLMSLMCGVGWFATNSTSGAWALSTLTHLRPLPCLAIVVVVQVFVAFAGHNLVQAFERYAFPVLAVIFVVAVIVVFAKSSPGDAAPAAKGVGGIGGFLLTVGTAFGYTAGWNPYAADYTRYLPSATSRRAVGWSAAIGLFVSTTLLMAAGSASTTIAGASGPNPTAEFTSTLPSVLAHLVLLAIVVGAVAANVLNVYSGSMAFVVIGITGGARFARAAIAVVFGVVGFLVAWWALPDAAASYESFLLIVAYWIGPWLGVVIADQWLRRDQAGKSWILYDRAFTNWGGVGAFLIGLVVSVALFSNQEKFTGVIAKQVPQLGDLTFFVGFLIGGGLYLAFVASSIRGSRPGAHSKLEA
ncbi:purine-cytosine permease family protein [Tsukamurella soli]|uniref:Cytosine permease n=1 Tax=Tsukamurella soli TaxID=644556 RepID=A0ABP8JI23_9ACTN